MDVWIVLMFLSLIFLCSRTKKERNRFNSIYVFFLGIYGERMYQSIQVLFSQYQDMLGTVLFLLCAFMALTTGKE